MKFTHGSTETPISMQLRPRANLYYEYALPVFSLAVAFLFFLTGVIAPWLQSVRQSHWVGTPAVVSSATLRTCPGENATFSLGLDFTYIKKSGERGIGEFLTSGNVGPAYDQAQKIKARYPVGTKIVCFINPNDPNQAVWQRSRVGASEVECLLAGLVFLGLGRFVLWQMRRNRRVVFQDLAWRPPAPPGQHGLRKTGTPPLPQAIFITCIVGIFVTLALLTPPWQTVHGTLDRLLLGISFTVSFGVVGVLTVNKFLRATDPRSSLTASAAAICSGDTLDLTWQIGPGPREIRQLTITLEGQEVTTWWRNNRPVTESQVFLRLPLYGQGQGSLGQTATVHRGTVRLQLPLDLLHSFQGKNNQVAYTVKLEAPIRFWPDFCAEFELVVEPGVPISGIATAPTAEAMP